MLSKRTYDAIAYHQNCAMISTIAADASPHMILVLCYQKTDDTSPYNPKCAVLSAISDDASPHNPKSINMH